MTSAMSSRLKALRQWQPARCARSDVCTVTAHKSSRFRIRRRTASRSWCFHPAQAISLHLVQEDALRACRRSDGKRQATARLVRYIRKESFTKTFAALAREVDLDEKTVRHVFDDFIEEFEAKVRFRTPRILGIDELKIIGQYRAMITNIERKSGIRPPAEPGQGRPAALFPQPAGQGHHRVGGDGHVPRLQAGGACHAAAALGLWSIVSISSGWPMTRWRSCASAFARICRLGSASSSRMSASCCSSGSTI